MSKKALSVSPPPLLDDEALAYVDILYQKIAVHIENARKNVRRSIDIEMVQAYWLTGRDIVEEEQEGSQRSEYGAKTLEILAKKLKNDFGRGFDIRNLRYMRQFCLTYPIRNALRSELSWTHYRLLLRVKNVIARDWYATECIANHWSTHALDRQIGTMYYERLLSSRERQYVIQEAKEKTEPLQIDVKNCLRDPYILDFLNVPHESILETTIEKGLINNLQKFLLELGRGFAFVERQQKLQVEDQNFAIDLVFYNFRLKCFLLIDVKVSRLEHQDVGQMDTYVRIYDQHIKSPDDNPTVGLILCSEKSEAIAKYSVLTGSKQIFASKYLLYLPSEEELIQELQREMEQLSHLKERGRAGLCAARARGRLGGKPKGLSQKAQATACVAETLYKERKLTTEQILKQLNISRATLYNYLRYRQVKIGS